MVQQLAPHSMLLLVFGLLSESSSSSSSSSGKTCGGDKSNDESCKQRDGTLETSRAIISMRPIGHGVFGSFMANVATQITGIEVLHPSFTRSSGLDWNTAVGNSVDAVYITTPDTLHGEQAIECLGSGKHVLVEKPVFGFANVQRAAEKAGTVLMVGFHRRHDKEYIRAKLFASSQKPPQHVVFESYDPVPADADLANVVRNSIVHDIDLLYWMFPEVDQIELVGTVVDVKVSGIILNLRMISTSGVGRHEFDATIKYKKLNPTYTQRVTVDGTVFGYDFAAPKDVIWPNIWSIAGPGMAAYYEPAYTKQFETFVELINNGASDANAEKLQKMFNGYGKTFSLMDLIASEF